MLTLSQSTGYAINALTCIGNRGGESALIRDIAECAEVPAPYLAKLLVKLAAAGLVQSKRGLRGGVRLTRSPDAISLYDIVEAIDGENPLTDCLLGMATCSDARACPTHEMWTRVRKQIEVKLRETSLAEVSDFQRAMKKRRAEAEAAAQCTNHAPVSLKLCSKTKQKTTKTKTASK